MLGGVVAIAAAAIARSQAAPNEWVFLLIGAGVVSIALGISGLIYDGVRAWRRSGRSNAPINQTFAGGVHVHNYAPQASPQNPVPAPAPALATPPDWLNANLISDRSFRLVDVPRQAKNLVGKTFERCSIFGPAIVMGASSDNSIIRCTWDGEGFPLAIEMDEGALMNTGMIGLVACRFLECHFYGVGIAAPPGTTKEFPPEAVYRPKLPPPTKPRKAKEQ